MSPEDHDGHDPDAGDDAPTTGSAAAGEPTVTPHLRRSSFSTRRPVAVLVIFLAAGVFGFFSYGRLPVSLMPELSYPTLTVRTEYPGAAPEEVENDISRPVEEALGVVGGLQFDVMADRIRTEYDLPVRFEPTELYTARWVEGEDARELKKFIDANKSAMAEDYDGAPVFMARNAWHLNKAVEDWPNLKFSKTREHLE